MLPIAPLMMEHRLIERMIALMHKEMERMQTALTRDPAAPAVNPGFIDTAVDFIRTYADKTHHGKEEDILFIECAKKNLSAPHRALLDELLADHNFGRRTTRSLLEAKENFLLGDTNATREILDCMGKLVDFYPKHIDKEDNHFFVPCMDYFSQQEKDDMLARMWERDREMIHEKYRGVVEGLE
ncbi:MAG: cation-binding protein [Deltaproteobacteria bacterium]|nr:MAG: cation-binding protein [Deltaproteobacteria bacterium]